MSTPARHRVVIIGGGFGGLLCAQHLKKSPVEITLIDRRNFHLFQPLLYQVATGALSPANIAAPLRSLMKRQRNCQTMMTEVTGFDTDRKEVLTAEGNTIPFDTLVLATGSTHHYFGNDALWEQLAPGLKTIEDATEIRRKVLSAFEQAEKESDLAKQNQHITFVVVGGGPTGVEMAGAICELAKQTMSLDFRNINPKNARILLVENSERILQAFDEKLSASALNDLVKLGVEPILNSRVIDVQPTAVTIQSKTKTLVVPCNTVVWAAGVKGSPLGVAQKASLSDRIQTDHGGRVLVNKDCSVGNRGDIFVIGDLAHHVGLNGKPLPGVAPVAMQQGQYLARLIDRRVRGQTPVGEFRYHDKGSMATIGRTKAVAQTGHLKLTGFVAWLAWLFIHILYLARFENRVLVLFQWSWNYVTRNRTARLITGELK